MNRETVIIPSVNIMNVALGSENNSVLAQVGDVQNEDVEDYQCQWVQQSGFCSLPPNAVPNGTSSEGIMLKTSYNSYVFASRDFASQANYGQLAPGESCMYAAGPDGSAQARMMCKADGSVTMYTTDDNTINGNAIYIRVSPKGFEFKAPFGRMTFDSTGFHVANASGARMDLAGTAAPPPLDTVIGSSITFTAPSFNVNSGSIMLGPQTGVNLPAVYGVVPVAAPGVPILGTGVGLVTVAAAASTSVFIGV